MDKGDNPYQLLDVPQNCDYVTIKKAYRRLALEQHPDRGGDAKKFAKIANAYEILSDPKQRHNYDLQQRHGSKGYDPKAPEFTSTRDDYDPSKPDYNPSSTPTSSSNPSNVKYYHPDDQGDDVEETWTTFTTMKNGVPVTQTRKNKTYTRTTSSQPTTRTSTTTSTHHFQMDPMELFRQQFPEGAKAFNNKSPRKTTTTSKQQQQPQSIPTTSTTKTTKMPMRTMQSSSPSSCMGGAPPPGVDNDITGMASGTRTVTHPDGRQELITETVITRADGSSETKVESKMISGPKKTTSSTKSTMMPMNTTTYYPSPTKNTTTIIPTTNRSITSSSSSKPTKSTTTSTTTTMYPTTTKGVKKLTSSTTPTTSKTTTKSSTKKSIPTTTTTYTTTYPSPATKSLTTTPTTTAKNKHVVFKNGKPVTVYLDE